MLHAITNSQEEDLIAKNKDTPTMTSVSIDDLGILDTIFSNKMDNPKIEIEQNSTDYSDRKYKTVMKTMDQVLPCDYIRRETVLWIQHLKNKKKMERQILKTQLEVEQIKKRAALLEEERNMCLLEKAKIELGELKKSIAK